MLFKVARKGSKACTCAAHIAEGSYVLYATLINLLSDVTEPSSSQRAFLCRYPDASLLTSVATHCKAAS